MQTLDQPWAAAKSLNALHFRVVKPWRPGARRQFPNAG
jgi:hypothetical protein